MFGEGYSIGFQILIAFFHPALVLQNGIYWEIWWLFLYSLICIYFPSFIYSREIACITLEPDSSLSYILYWVFVTNVVCTSSILIWKMVILINTSLLHRVIEKIRWINIGVIFFFHKLNSVHIIQTLAFTWCLLRSGTYFLIYFSFIMIFSPL